MEHIARGTSVASRTRAPASCIAVAHGPAGNVELPTQVGTVCEEGRDRGSGVAVVPGQRVIDFVRGLGLFFKRAHVVVLLCLMPQQASFLGNGWAAASPACSQYVLVVDRVNRHVQIITMGPL